ncbi:MAG: hypothetical protein LHV68_09885 [Elusimicrobia bacterium]|nr:hypothetical protein [Candidatus Liberimonas magnetica]
MNSFSCSGKVSKISEPIFLNENTMALRFTVMAVNGQVDSQGKPRADYVPCILFNPSEELQGVFAGDKTGFVVEFSGKVSSTNLPNPNQGGKKSFRTEVIVYKNTLLLKS